MIFNVEKTKEFFSKNTALLTKAMIAIFVIACGYFYWSYLCEQKEIAARKEFYQAEKQIKEQTKSLKTDKEIKEFFKEKKDLLDSYSNLVLKYPKQAQSKEFALKLSSFFPRVEAIKLLKSQEKYLKKDIISSLVFVRLGSLLLDEKKYKEAREAFKNAGKNSQTKDVALFKTIVSYLDESNFEQAEEVLKELGEKDQKELYEKAKNLIQFYKVKK